MIIIDEHVNRRLLEDLDALKQEAIVNRCIHFKADEIHDNAQMKDAIFTATTQHAETQNTKVFLCPNGDVFVLCSQLTVKEGKAIIIEVAATLNIPAKDSWVTFHEVASEIRALASTIRTELAAEQKAEEQRIAQKAAEENEKHTSLRRQAILNGGAKRTAADIHDTRRRRMHAEIMIIEDDAFSRKLVKNVLAKQYSLTELGEATDALDIYAKIAPNLLLLDINLPDVTGHELLERITVLDPDSHVVMLSGNCDQKNIKQAIEKGAKGFIAKPFTRAKLFEYIDNCPTITSRSTA